MINLSDRITDKFKESSRIVIDGDLWLDGKGLAIQKPPVGDPKYLEIREGFATQNVLEEISDRRRDGILGREPRYQIVPENGGDISDPDAEKIRQILAAVVRWWNDRNMLETMREMLTRAHCEQRVAIRPYAAPSAYESIGDSGLKTLKRFGSVAEALDSLYFDIHRADAAGVFTDDETLRPFSVFKTKRGDEEVTQVSITDDEGFTHLTEVRERDLSGAQFLKDNFANSLAVYAKDLINRQAENEEVKYAPLYLKRRLYLFELDLRKPFISEAMKSLQKQISLILTMDGRNIYAAGIRKEHHLNTEPPKMKTIVGGVEKTVDAPLRQGAGVRNFLQGSSIFDENGKLIGRASPSVVIVDPVSSEHFIDSANDKRARILAMADQLHVLMSDSATASGISRREARDEFRKSLNDAKSPLDELGRYIIEFAVMFAANLTNQTELFKNFRCNFDCVVDAGAPSPEEKKENREAYEKGEIDLETLRSLNGVEDADAMDVKVKSEPAYEVRRLDMVFDVLTKAAAAGNVLTIEEKRRLIYPEKTDEEIAADLAKLSAETPAPTV